MNWTWPEIDMSSVYLTGLMYNWARLERIVSRSMMLSLIQPS